MLHPIKLLYNRGGKLKINNKLVNIGKHIKRVIPTKHGVSQAFKKMSIGKGAPHMKLPEIIMDMEPEISLKPMIQKRVLRPLKFKK
jgi:hypothetical protein